MAPDRILWFIPYDVHAAPVWSLPYFNTWPEIIYLAIVNFTAVLITAGYANSRTMLARIAPAAKMTEFFGLYSLSGTSTTFLATGSATGRTMLARIAPAAKMTEFFGLSSLSGCSTTFLATGFVGCLTAVSH